MLLFWIMFTIWVISLLLFAMAILTRHPGWVMVMFFILLINTVTIVKYIQAIQ